MREQKDRYEIFLKVCETGSFSKAAEALNYTQSGISQMMAGLEEELGVQLFARINRGVTLTDNGTRLLPYIRELANQKTRLRQAAFNINHKVEGKLRVGSISSITTLWMPEVVHYFKEHYPKVKIEILDGNYDEIRDWIIHGQVRQRYPAPDAQVPGEAEYCIQLPGRYPHHGLRAQRAGRDHLAGAGDAGIRLPRCGVPPAGACLLPDAGAGVFQDGKLGGEPDAAGISEIHPAAKGYTADKIRTKSVIY